MNALEQAQRQAVVQEAISWLRTPWIHHARVKGAGVDCGMFLAEVYPAAGVTAPIDPGEYPNDWHQHQEEQRYLRIVETYAHRIDTPPQPGDIALFSWGRCISHGGIVVEYPRIIHSFAGHGVVYGDLVHDLYLAKRLAGFWSPWGGAP